MNLPVSRQIPTVMHIDLNSCFATVEQQAYPSLRGKPLVIAAYTTPGGCILAPSIEAKKLGIKVGMTVREARLIERQIIVRDPDPQMVRHIHFLFKKIAMKYSPLVSPKSIDEVVIDFANTPALKTGLEKIGLEIKNDIKKEIGEWVLCNIGISTNRFLAKLAASLNKPDGLDRITRQNIENVYSRLTLTDLPGINIRFQARLNACGIFTPLEFFKASLNVLWHEVFKSINGYYWYLRLRGWEIDAVDFSRKSFGQSYALQQKTCKTKELAKILMKLCEKMGRRLRRHLFTAQGIHVSCVYDDQTYWHKGKIFQNRLYTIKELYTKALLIFNQSPQDKKVREIAVSCFALAKTDTCQLEFFNENYDKKIKVQKAVDRINDKFGEYIMTPALMMGMEKKIIDRIAFGAVKEIEEIYL